jgi:hypothetical protein
VAPALPLHESQCGQSLDREVHPEVSPLTHLRSASVPLQSQALPLMLQQLLFDVEPLELPLPHDVTLLHPEGSGLFASPHFVYEA